MKPPLRTKSKSTPVNGQQATQKWSLSIASTESSDGTVDHLLCPITLELPFEPVMAQDGFVYDKKAIQTHIQTRRDQKLELNSPLTNRRMGDTLLPAPHVKELIGAMIQKGAVPGELADAWNRTAQQHREKEEWLRQARAGDAHAMSTVGYHYMWGYGAFEHDGPAGLAWTRRAHEAGDVVATGRLGFYLVAGCGTQRCHRHGLLYLGIAAAQGSDISAYVLGIGFADGRYGLDASPLEAVRWLQKCLDPSCKFQRLNKVCQENARQRLRDLNKDSSPEDVTE